LGRGTNRKLVYELLIVVYSNFRRHTHRFSDTSCFNAENHIFAMYIFNSPTSVAKQ